VDTVRYYIVRRSFARLAGAASARHRDRMQESRCPPPTGFARADHRAHAVLRRSRVHVRIYEECGAAGARDRVARGDLPAGNDLPDVSIRRSWRCRACGRARWPELGTAAARRDAAGTVLRAIREWKPQVIHAHLHEASSSPRSPGRSPASRSSQTCRAASRGADRSWCAARGGPLPAMTRAFEAGSPAGPMCCSSAPPQPRPGRVGARRRRPRGAAARRGGPRHLPARRAGRRPRRSARPPRQADGRLPRRADAYQGVDLLLDAIPTVTAAVRTSISRHGLSERGPVPRAGPGEGRGRGHDVSRTDSVRDAARWLALGDVACRPSSRSRRRTASC